MSRYNARGRVFFSLTTLLSVAIGVAGCPENAPGGPLTIPSYFCWMDTTGNNGGSGANYNFMTGYNMSGENSPNCGHYAALVPSEYIYKLTRDDYNDWTGTGTYTAGNATIGTMTVAFRNWGALGTKSGYVNGGTTTGIAGTTSGVNNLSAPDVWTAKLSPQDLSDHTGSWGGGLGTGNNDPGWMFQNEVANPGADQGINTLSDIGIIGYGVHQPVRSQTVFKGDYGWDTDYTINPAGTAYYDPRAMHATSYGQI